MTKEEYRDQCPLEIKRFKELFEILNFLKLLLRRACT
jgi:hypothetical protein